MKQEDRKIVSMIHMNTSKTISLPNRIYTFCLIISPVINQYQLPGLTFIEIVAVIGVVLKFTKNTTIQKSKYLLFAMIGFLTSITMTLIFLFTCTGFDIDLINYILRMIKYLIVVLGIGVAARDFLELEYAKKIYTIVVLVTTLVFLGQYIIHTIMGQNVYALIPGMTLNYNGGVNSSELMAENISKVARGYYYRPSSIFIEPAHYALYVIPWIALRLFGDDKLNVKQFTFAIIVTICTLLTTSSLAVLGCAFVWIAFYIRYMKQAGGSRQRLILVPVLLFGGIVAVYYLSQNAGIATAMGIKIKSLSNLSESSSTTVRLFRGWLFYSKLDLLSQVIGVGYGNLSAYYKAVGMYLIYDSTIDEVSYMSGITTILNSFGIIGITLFLRWILGAFKSRNFQGKILIAVLFVILLTSDCYDSATYWVIISFITALKSTGTLF